MAQAKNSLVASGSRKDISFSEYAKADASQKSLLMYIPDQRERARFTSAIISAVDSNPKIAACTNRSIMQAGLKCINYDFLPGGELGDAYLIPFDDKCTLMLGYKGLIRLAQRSGKVRTLNMGVVRKGQNVKRDYVTGDVTITGEPESPDADAIGYFAFIRLAGSGFEKTEYMTKQEAVAHAHQYAKSNFDKDLFAKYEKFLKTGEGLTKEEESKCGGVYYTNFDAMAKKNVMRRLLLTWAPLSITDNQMLAHDENPSLPLDMPEFGEEEPMVMEADAVVQEIPKQAVAEAPAKKASPQRAADPFDAVFDPNA